MAQYKVADVFNSRLVTGQSPIKNFINLCKVHLEYNKLKDKLTPLQNELFCYEIDGKVGFSRKILEEVLTTANFKTKFSNKAIQPFIQKMIGEADLNKDDFFDLEENQNKIGTRLKQDFTCFTVVYFFNNLNTDHYQFLDDLRQGKLKIDKQKTSVTADISDFKIFGYKEHYLKFFDSVATAQTIVQNKIKINLKHNLNSYCVAEEESPVGKKLKSIPFGKIKNTEANYYSDENKLSTADIYIYDKTSENYKNLSKVFNKKTLTHEQYRSFINFSFDGGDLIPISLKELRTTDVNESFISSRVKVLNFMSESEDVQDKFLKKILELLAIKQKDVFVREMEKVIDIRNDTINLNPYGTRTTFNFDAVFDDNSGSQRYDVFIQGNQLYIKPPDSSSDAGLGGVTMEYLKNQILNKLPDRGRYNRMIANARKKAFEQFYEKTQDVSMSVFGSLENKTPKELQDIILKYKLLKKSDLANRQKKELISLIEDMRTFKKYKNYQLLRAAKILSPSEFGNIMSGIPESLRIPIASAYIQELYSQLEHVPNVDTTLKGEFRSKTFTRDKLILNKLSDMEILFFLACNKSIVKKWIKNSFILGAYGILSATGIVLLDGKKHTLGKGKAGILRRNPVFVKIGD